MKKKLFLLALLCAGCSLIAPAQEALKPTPLEKGALMPDLQLAGLIHYPTATASLKGIQRDKLLILHFWATWCGVCQATMPRINELQVQHSDNVQVLMVTYEDGEAVERFFQRFPQLENKEVPVLCKDQVLNRYFRHRYVPHDVWVMPNGRVLEATSPLDLTDANIDAALGGRQPLFTPKKDDLFFDFNKVYQPGDSIRYYRSLLSPFNPSIGNGLAMEPADMDADSLRRLFVYNNDAISLYYYAFSQLRSPQPDFSRINVSPEDSVHYRWPDTKGRTGAEFRRGQEQSSFCYELAFPKAIPRQEFFRYMFEDLNRVLPLKGKIEKKKQPCWVLTTDPSRSRPPSVQADTYWTWEGPLLKKIAGTPLSTFIAFLQQFPTAPIINETGLSSEQLNWDINLDVGNYTKLNMEQVQALFKQHGFKLEQQYRVLDFLSLSDTP